MLPGGLMIAMQEGAPVIPCGIDTFGWSPTNRRPCALVWGEPISLDDLPRNRKGYAEAAERVGAEIVSLWRQAAEAAAAGLPPQLPDGTRSFRVNPRF
jgi:1-acyl-sn-glycerol-3-phosphate acyltransferase